MKLNHLLYGENSVKLSHFGLKTNYNTELVKFNETKQIHYYVLRKNNGVDDEEPIFLDEETSRYIEVSYS